MLLDSPEYVVHPPVGKWMIAAGMWLFGPDNPFGWRFGAALTGTLSIFLLALIAQKLFRSLTLGAVAGVLLAVDGHHLVMSRTSLLDIFLMFWVLAAFGALLMDRDDGRRRLAVRLGRQAAASPDGRPGLLQLASGPWLGIRWWRLAAGVCLGLAVGTKWSALFFLAGFGLLTVFWDLSARRIAGIHGWISGGILKDGIPAFLSIVPVAALVYAASWTGWFRSTGRVLPELGRRRSPRRSGAGCRTPSGPWRTTIWKPTSSTRGSARTIRTRPAPGAGWCWAGPRPSSTNPPSRAARGATRPAAQRRSSPSATR